MSNMQYLSERAYPGRGIVMGVTPDGLHAAIAYFIMGRSSNSRNRNFEKTEDGIRTVPYDSSLVEDPSLILYHPVRKWGNSLIVTNGDQTDTILAFLQAGKSFEEALKTRCYEPDAPHFTTRISGMVTIEKGNARIQMNLLRKAKGSDTCLMDTYAYEAPALGEAYIIHTYADNTEPLPPFMGEPKSLSIPYDDIDAFTQAVWESLHDENRISLYTCFLPLNGKAAFERIVNRFS